MNHSITSAIRKFGLFACVLCLAGSAFAQTSMSTDSTQRPARRQEWNRKQQDGESSQFGRFEEQRKNGRDRHIRYTAEERVQLKAIRQNYQQQSADLFRQDQLTLKEYKKRLLALQQDRKKKMIALLTPQQQQQIAMRKKRMTEDRQVKSVARLERLRLQLNLSDDQVAKLKSGQEAIRSQLQTIRSNDNLLPEEKREQLKHLMAQRRESFKTILNADQYTKFEQMHYHRMGDRDRERS